MLAPAELLREARLEAGLTQAALAARAGTSQPALARYETGAVIPSLPTLERLLEGCGRALLIESVPTAEQENRPRLEHVRRDRRRLVGAARRHGVRDLRLFGSTVREESGPESDVDLLVTLGPGRTLLDLVDFRTEASEILGLRVDVVTLDLLKNHVRERVQREAIPV